MASKSNDDAQAHLPEVLIPISGVNHSRLLGRLLHNSLRSSTPSGAVDEHRVPLVCPEASPRNHNLAPPSPGRLQVHAVVQDDEFRNPSSGTSMFTARNDCSS